MEQVLTLERIPGLMIRMEIENQRHWLMNIHCINHKVEFTAKKAILESPFKDIDKFCLKNYYLLRDSSKTKPEVKKTPSVIGIHYTLSRMTATRSIRH